MEVGTRNYGQIVQWHLIVAVILWPLYPFILSQPCHMVIHGLLECSRLAEWGKLLGLLIYVRVGHSLLTSMLCSTLMYSSRWSRLFTTQGTMATECVSNHRFHLASWCSENPGMEKRWDHFSLPSHILAILVEESLTQGSAKKRPVWWSGTPT